MMTATQGYLIAAPAVDAPMMLQMQLSTWRLK